MNQTDKHEIINKFGVITHSVQMSPKITYINDAY